MFFFTLSALNRPVFILTVLKEGEGLGAAGGAGERGPWTDFLGSDLEPLPGLNGSVILTRAFESITLSAAAFTNICSNTQKGACVGDGGRRFGDIGLEDGREAQGHRELEEGGAQPCDTPVSAQ